ncbi:hypothetical protein RLEG12_03905 (plasmid) [Rhizobium leguminosarum bv. trifolii CB782]|nr:hypothetical protein RLEG12_03905 [Rhizobium leguminosarum bv. trifolii CB782]
MQSPTAIAHGHRGGRCDTGRDEMGGMAQVMPSHTGAGTAWRMMTWTEAHAGERLALRETDR